MTTWARTTSGDMLLPLVNSGQSALVTDPDLCTQIKLADRFRLWFGEWFLNRTKGFKWQSIVGQRSPNLAVARQMVRAYTLATPRIVSADDVSLTLAPATRHVTIAGTARTSTGTVAIGASPQ